MERKLVNETQTIFERIRQIDEKGNEFWGARQFAKALGYSDFRNFLLVVNKAKEACKNSGQQEADHLVEFTEMVTIGSGANREMKSVKLSRYACYLIVQNADPSKEIVALGQTYFAVQTRIQEIQQMQAYEQLNTEEERRLFLRDELTSHNKKLASAAKNAGVVTALDYAVFQNHGYMGLYNGLDARSIHQRKNLKKGQNILDHMGSSELAANLFRATQTEDKLRREDITGKGKANQTHYDVGRKVRKTIAELGGTMPENLPVEKSIKGINKDQIKKLKEK